MADNFRLTAPKRALLKREMLCNPCYDRCPIRHRVADKIIFLSFFSQMPKALCCQNIITFKDGAGIATVE